MGEKNFHKEKASGVSEDVLEHVSVSGRFNLTDGGQRIGTGPPRWGLGMLTHHSNSIRSALRGHVMHQMVKQGIRKYLSRCLSIVHQDSKIPKVYAVRHYT